MTQLKLTEQDYLEGEELAEFKHEFIGGVAYAMAGGSEDHNVITGNVFGELRQQLKRTPCLPFIAEMKVRASGNIFYPDVMVVCESHESDTHLVKNAPSLIVEVLSASTRKKDFTSKKIAYLNIPSLQEYVLIEQDRCEVEVFRRSENWASTYYILGDTITFDSIGVSLSVEEIYDRVENDDIILFFAEQT